VLSDQLSDYEGEDGYTTAHVDIRSSRSARDFGRASGMLHTEEVTGSNPVSPTNIAPSQSHLSEVFSELRAESAGLTPVRRPSGSTT
jgi:hypothetical protein